MSDRAYAIVITENNFSAILSEAGRKFDREFLEMWFAHEGEGYFVRDKTSASLDCCLFPLVEFHRLYMFSRGDESVLFREITRL